MATTKRKQGTMTKVGKTVRGAAKTVVKGAKNMLGMSAKKSTKKRTAKKTTAKASSKRSTGSRSKAKSR